MQTPHESRMCLEKLSPRGVFVLLGQPRSSYTYHHETSYFDSTWVEDGPYWFWDQKVKGQGHIVLITENGLCCNIAFGLYLSSWNTYKDSPWVGDVSYWFWGPKVKGQGHNALITENGLSHYCFPLTPFIMKFHTKAPHESRMCPIDFGVRRSRSQCIYYWKWFLLHNCFPFTPIVMKLHIKTPAGFLLFLLFPTFPTFLFWSYFFLLFLQILLLFLLFKKKKWRKKFMCLNQMK